MTSQFNLEINVVDRNSDIQYDVAFKIKIVSLILLNKMPLQAVNTASSMQKKKRTVILHMPFKTKIIS